MCNSKYFSVNQALLFQGLTRVLPFPLHLSNPREREGGAATLEGPALALGPREAVLYQPPELDELPVQLVASGTEEMSVDANGNGLLLVMLVAETREDVLVHPDELPVGDGGIELKSNSSNIEPGAGSGEGDSSTAMKSGVEGRTDANKLDG